MGRPQPTPPDVAQIRGPLLAWYEIHQRDLPWRRNKDPYSIWVSEIMLQQTRVAVVIERYKAFLERFPTILSLALAPEQDVLALWSGLGYYRRARMLHKAAQFVAEHLNGTLPATANELHKLPGIGSYTAAAIASIAHNQPVAVVDGNVERVICRLAGWHADTKAPSALRRRIESVANQLVHPLRPGDFNQAMMELGATVCLPRNPQCLVCPLAPACKTRGEHKTAPRARMQSREVAYALATRITPETIEVLLDQRPTSVTVMPGMWELPSLRDSRVPPKHLRMTVRHAIMQVNYYVRIRELTEPQLHEMHDAATVPSATRRWVPLADLPSLALTGLARKVLTRAHLLMPRAAPTPRRGRPALNAAAAIG